MIEGNQLLRSESHLLLLVLSAEFAAFLSDLSGKKPLTAEYTENTRRER